jgi:hypothetical protein
MFANGRGYIFPLCACRKLRKRFNFSAHLLSSVIQNDLGESSCALWVTHVDQWSVFTRATWKPDLRTSIELEAKVADDACPFCDLITQKALKLRRRAADGLSALLRCTVLEHRRRQGLTNFAA